MKPAFSDILQSIEDKRQRRIASKLPTWARTDGIVVPSDLSLEQCSSEAAAKYKASILEYSSVADLTSGLGVDVWAFSAHAKEVIYNECNTKLYESALKNFEALECGNVKTYNLDASEILNTLPHQDLIYLDPARRDKAGRKVFLLEDCSPNVLEFMPSLWRHTDKVMIKVSPMADISMLQERLEGIKTIHIVGVHGECREILCILEHGWNGPVDLISAELDGRATSLLHFNADKVGNSFSCRCPEIGEMIFEPLPSLAKSGRFSAICNRFSLCQLDISTHLFCSGDKGSQSGLPEAFFKIYELIDSVSMNKGSLKSIGQKYPRADVSARNIPMSSDELGKRMGVTPGGDTHIFGVSVMGNRMLLVCKKMPRPEDMV